MPKSPFKVIILQDGTSAQRVYRLSRFKSIFITFVLVAILSGITYSISWYFAQRMTRISMAQVVNENHELRRELEGINQKISKVKTELTDLFESDDKLRLLADMPKIDDDVRQVGIGGTAAPNFDFNSKDETVRKLIFDLDKLERELSLQRSSFQEIKKRFLENSDLIDHTPSIRPVEGGFVSSSFGYRIDPFTHRRAHHNGIDICIEVGTPISATADGKVIFARRTPGMGKTVIIDHGYGFRTAYGHMDRILVKSGQSVVRGQKIGEVGNTGRSTGPHIHYEVQVDKKAVDPVDYLFDDFAIRNID